MTRQDAMRHLRILRNELDRRLRMQTLPGRCYEQFMIPFNAILEPDCELFFENVDDGMYYIGEHGNKGERLGVGMLYKGGPIQVGQSMHGVQYHYYIGRWENGKRRSGITIKFDGTKGIGADAFTLVELVDYYNDQNVPDGHIIKVQPIGTFEGTIHGSERNFTDGWKTDGTYSSRVKTVDAGTSEKTSKRSGASGGCMVTLAVVVAALAWLLVF